MLVTVDDSVMWTLFIGFIVAGVLAAIMTVLVILAFLLTPVRVWLKAKIRGKSIVEARRRDRKVDLAIGETYIQGLVSTKEYGSFIVDPDSVYTAKKGGISMLPVNAEVGITLSPKVLQIIDGLKRMGFNNIEDAMAYNVLWGRCDCGYEGIMDFEKDKDSNPILINGNPKLICPMLEKEEETNVQETGKTEENPTGTAGESISPAPTEQINAPGDSL